ncbi:MAG: hypothetical protein ABI340_10115 [Nitrososphaera sp.]|jgi:hypothetical protein
MQETPNQKWKKQISQNKKKCQAIIQLSKSIRYVGLINEYGRTLTGIIRPGLKTLLTNEPARNEFFLVSTLLSMRNKTSTALGKMDYALFRHNKITIIAFQRNEGIYYISLNQNIVPSTLHQIISKIKKII